MTRASCWSARKSCSALCSLRPFSSPGPSRLCVRSSKDLLARYLENAHQDIYTAKQLRLVIEWSAQAIGLIDLFDFNPKHKRASVGIVVAAAYRSKGFAKRALNLIVAYAKDTLDCHQIVATITEDNSESMRLFESAGFKRTGVREDWVFEKGVYKGEYFYQRIL